jgi:hypothetical protein
MLQMSSEPGGFALLNNRKSNILALAIGLK